LLGEQAVFRDKTRILGGQEWITTIEDNARSCRIMLVVIGPSWQTAAFMDGDRKGFPRLSDSQDWVRREIRLSLDAGNIVVPIRVNGASIPTENWLAGCGLGRLHGRQAVELNADDYDTHLARLLATLRAHCPELFAQVGPAGSGRRDFYQHVALPPNYVIRGPVISELVSVLLSDRATVALTSGVPSRPAALHGLGGIGKSVLARAACEHADVRAAFPDGILWTTLGQTPNIKSCLHEWIVALEITVPGVAPTVNVMAEALARAFERRACLLVVDDVWMAEQLRAFSVPGPRCRLLITTRNAALARQFGARIYPINAMSEGEAARLLEKWSDDHLADVPACTRNEILAKLGGLPLAIKLAGAQLQRTPADEWLATFDGTRAIEIGAGVLDRDGSISACLRLTMDALDARSCELGHRAPAVTRRAGPARAP
jgi:hypothetical protein